MLINDHRFKDYNDFATPKKTISLIITMQSHLCNQLFAALAII